MLERLFQIYIEFKEYVVLAACLIASLILFTLNDAPQVKQIRTVMTVFYGFAQEYISFIPRYFSLKSENELLRRKNVELLDEVSRLREAKLENYRLRKLLEFKKEQPDELVAAKVISKNLLLMRNTLTVNVGTNNNIRELMPVINEDGIVGLVTNVSPNYAVINILLNTSFRISGKVQRSRVDGIVRWDGRDLLFENVPKTFDVVKGDVIVTSGYSQIFPPNIKIGVVNSVIPQPGSLFNKIILTPAVNFVRLEEVFIIKRVPNDELLTLEHNTSPEQHRAVE